MTRAKGRIVATGLLCLANFSIASCRSEPATVPLPSSNAHPPPSTPPEPLASATRHDACDRFFGPGGEPLASAHVLASVADNGMGGSSRLEVIAPHTGRYVESRVNGPRTCFERELSSSSVDALGHALASHRFCELHALAERTARPMPTDAGFITLEAHLPGVSCTVGFMPFQAQRADAGDASSWTQSLDEPFRSVFEAFDRVEAEVTGGR